MPNQTFPPCFYRISAKALILNEKNEFLLCKEDGIHNLGHWELPGGGLEFGETAEQCITREIQEEMGLTVASVHATPCYFSTTTRTKNWNANVLYITTVTNYNFTASDECVEFGWFTKESTKLVELSSNAAAFIEQFDPSNH